MSKDKLLVLSIILIGVGGLVIMMSFVGQGNVRHVPIYWPERVEQTISFEEIDGKTHIKGISGVAGEPNPHLITRTNFAYILTVINNGDNNHRLFIEGLDVQTKSLQSGKQETLTIHASREGIYKYFDIQYGPEFLGYLEVKTVVPSDEFTGIFRDLI